MYDVTIISVILSKLIILQADIVRFYVYIYVIYFCHIQISINEYFDSNSFSSKVNIFIFLLFSEDNR